MECRFFIFRHLQVASPTMTTTPTERSGIYLMLVSIVGFAINVLLIRGISIYMPEADGLVASLFRGVVGLIIVSALFYKRGFQPLHMFTRPLLIARGLLGGFGILAFYITLVHLGAGRSVIINLSYPIFGSLIARWFLKEHLSAKGWAWMVAGFTGLVIFLGGGIDFSISGYDLLAVAGAVAAGAVIVLIRQLRHSEHTSTIYASQCFASAMLAMVPAAKPSMSLPPGVLALMIGAAVMVAAGQLSMTHAYRSLSVARGSSIQMILPIVTALGGWLLFGETFTAIELGGAALTLFATWRVLASPPTVATTNKATA